MFPGLIVQVPVGNPLKTTEPVAKAQVGCVTVPTIGIEGVVGCALISTFFFSFKSSVVFGMPKAAFESGGRRG